MPTLLVAVGCALLVAVTIAVIMFVKNTLPRLDDALEAARAAMVAATKTADEATKALEQIRKAGSATSEGVSAVKVAVLEQARSVGQAAHEGIQAIADGAVQVAEAAKSVAPAVAGAATGIGGYYVAKTVAGAAAERQIVAPLGGSGVPLGLQLGQIAIQVATLVYIKARFDRLESRIDAIYAGIGTQLNLLQRITVLNLLRDLTTARALFDLFDDNGDADSAVLLDKTELLEVISLIASGIAHARQLAAVTPTHEVLAHPFLAEHTGAQLAELELIILKMAADPCLGDPLVKRRSDHCHRLLKVTRSTWIASIEAPLLVGGVLRTVPGLPHTDVPARRRDLIRTMAPHALEGEPQASEQGC